MLLVSLSLISCEKILDVKPDDALQSEQFYQDKFDADAAVIGIYGKFLGLAEHYVVLNELRGDLMEVTPFAKEDMVQLSNHTVTPENKYANPRPFYELIVNCNDVLTNFDRMKVESKISEAEHAERYSDIAALRSWLYLQLAIHYGNVPYITDPLAKINDVKDLSRFPVLNLGEMVQELIRVMEALPYKEQYSELNTMNRVIDGYNTNKYFINKRVLMADLYLWNNDYRKAAEQYKQVMEGPNGNVNIFTSYKVTWADVATNNDLTVGYLRYAEQDTRSLVEDPNKGWRSMFMRTPDAIFNWEWIWYMQFDSRFEPKNPFVKLFSNTGGDYLVRPTKHAMDMWNEQEQLNGFPWDQRGRWTWKMQNGQPVIMKHIYNYSPLAPLETTGKWFLYRAALLHLRYSEAANRDNQRKIAWALLNHGRTAYEDANISDIYQKHETFQPFPYDFNFRNANVGSLVIREPWHQSAGIRGRANLRHLEMPENNTDQDSILYIEEKLVDEAALELAYEGNRWSDLLRVARRRNDPKFLADRVYAKLQKANDPGAAAAHAKLMNPANWFLPFRWE